MKSTSDPTSEGVAEETQPAHETRGSIDLAIDAMRGDPESANYARLYRIERYIDALQSRLTAALKERDELNAALDAHLCPYDKADWIGCAPTDVHRRVAEESGEPFCVVCAASEPHSHTTAAEERERKLVEALRKYGAHLSVDEYSDETTDCWGDPCTCGLAALLAGSKG